MTVRFEVPREGHAPVAVAVRGVSAAEAPVALVIDDAEGRLGRATEVALRLNEGALWRRLGERYGYEPLSGPAALREASTDPERYDNPFSGEDDPASRAAALLMVEGEVWERVPEPVLRYQNGTDEGQSWVTVSFDRPEDPTEAYRLDQSDVIAACHPGAAGLDLPAIRVIVPGVLTFAPMPAVVSRAALEAMEVLAGHELLMAGDRRLADIAEGPASEEDVAVILDVMAEADVTDGHPYALRHLLMRQEAVDMPLPLPEDEDVLADGPGM